MLRRRALLPAALLALSCARVPATATSTATSSERGAVGPAVAPATPASASPSPPLAPAQAHPPAPALVELPADRRWEDEVVYFVLVDRFADGDPAANAPGTDRSAAGAFHGGDLRGLREQLDEIASLGVTAIWVNPLVKNIDGYVTGAGFPDWGYHGYWADDLGRLDPRFGTEEELRALVRACHARGLKVLLDVAYNHVGYGSRYLRDPATRTWLRSGEHGGCGDDDETQCLSGLPDWKTELPEVRDFLITRQLDWARRSGVDGFRLDAVKHVDHGFWKEQRRRTRAELSPGFFLLGEVWGGDAQVLDPWFEGDELDAGFDFTFQGSALGFVSGRGRAAAFDRYLAQRHKVRRGHLLAHYLSSHDVPGALHELSGDTALFRLAVALQLTSTGIPVVYYGEEVGRPGGAWPQNRSDMPWGERPVLPGRGLARDEGLRGWYQRLLAARRAHPALRRGTHQGLVLEQDVYAFARRDAPSGDAVVVVVNRGAAAARTRFAAPSEWGSGVPVDLLGVAAASVSGPAIEIELPPRSAALLSPRRAATP